MQTYTLYLITKLDQMFCQSINKLRQGIKLVTFIVKNKEYNDGDIFTTHSNQWKLRLPFPPSALERKCLERNMEESSRLDYSLVHYPKHIPNCFDEEYKCKLKRHV